MAMDVGDEQSEIWTIDYMEAGRSFASHYFRFLNEYQENFDSLADEIENLIAAHNKIAEREDYEAQMMLISSFPHTLSGKEPLK